MTGSNTPNTSTLSVKERNVVLSIHDEKTSTEDVLLNSEFFPKWKEGDYIQILRKKPEMASYLDNTPANREREKTEKRKRRLVLRIKTLLHNKGKTLQISLSSSIAAAFDLTARTAVTVKLIIPERAEVEFVEIGFKDQYLGRSDMWRIKMSLCNSCAFTGKQIQFSSVKAQIREMVRGGMTISSGLITDRTKMIYRSRSAKFFVMIQMSREMWDFCSNGDLYFERATNGFLSELFERWSKLGANHTLSIVLFSRTFLNNETQTSPEVMTDAEGRRYIDFYKVVVEDMRGEWESILVQLKREFILYPSRVRWHYDPVVDGDRSTPSPGLNSTAEEGNFLESINLCLSVFERHYVDRDLQRTGQLICVVTAGGGTFDVDSNLSRLTKQKMIDNGIGCDIISLTSPPLHAVPLFRYPVEKYSPVGRTKGEEKTTYDVPHWLHISFYQGEEKSFDEIEKELNEIGFGKGLSQPWCVDRMIHGVQTWKKEENSKKILVPREPLTQVSTSTTPTYGRNVTSNYNATMQFSSYDEYVFNQEELPHSYRTNHIENSEPSEVSSYDERSNQGSIRSSRIGKLSAVGEEEEIPQRGQQVVRKRNHHRPINPFDSGDASGANNRKTSSRSRWVHLFSGTNNVRYTNVWPFPPNWKSLCEPASQPITNDFFPSPLELSKSFQDNVYHISLDVDDIHYQNKTDDFVKELVSQRLGQNYQFVISAEEEANDVNTNNSGTKVPTKRYVHYLSLGHNYHKITYGNYGQNVEVKRYHRSQLSNKAQSIPYRYYLWPVYNRLYETKEERCRDINNMISVDFQHTQIFSYPWNYLDQLVGGYFDELTNENAHYWRCRYAIVPNQAPTLTEGEAGAKQYHQDRSSSFQKFINVLQGSLKKAEYNTPNEVNKTSDQPPTDQTKTSTRPRRPKNFLDKSVRIENRTDRPEWLWLLYDSLYSPTSVCHIQFQWMVSTACVVEELVSNAQRKAKMCGFNMTQIPADQNPGPFSLSHIPIIIRDEVLQHISAEKETVEQILTTRFDFVRDTSKPDYFMHRSSSAFVHYNAPDQTIQWRYNPLVVQRTSMTWLSQWRRDFVGFWSELSQTKKILSKQEVHTPEVPVPKPLRDTDLRMESPIMRRQVPSSPIIPTSPLIREPKEENTEITMTEHEKMILYYSTIRGVIR
ncbi:hypothetical protein PROFUN_05133 [Planoprotostelium fungivorum]|uniref:Vacuolar membrane-associated protein IML1 n=1 Tax=Planoprotostelium fungivorum TaxID=1890364 RepID=A0A2P6NRR5_9EUKA|nr:hypothetical protein PROFUN_05133 [Planoprotostelium fungivorum]